MSIDLTQTIAPKSDQLNADDLIAGEKTITITQVSKSNTPDQPVAIGFEGDNGKPYKPCKSMRRVLVQVWGKDGQSYVGKSLTLYRDTSVKFGGVDVGGIRISHMSDIDKPITMALTASKTIRKPFTVQPLKVEAQKKAQDKQAPEVFTLSLLNPEGGFDEMELETPKDWAERFMQSLSLLNFDDALKSYKQNRAVGGVVRNLVDDETKELLTRATAQYKKA